MPNPMMDMEDNLHAVRQLIEAAMLLMNDLPGEDAERAYRVMLPRTTGN